MKLLLDEMHSPTVARVLQEAGHDVHAVSSDPLLRGMDDANLLQFAADTNRAIVTENVRDFAILISRWATGDTPHPNVIFTGQNRFNRRTVAYPANLIAALDQFLRQPPVKGHSWVWWLQPPP
ncbi:DUF5615 family PIN-like protein [Candidatus Poriferisocius sp.]|uniref:DUF5615 family PIN-like protein n=1 Tax=Candidatus Poriferisocius sp. TaxID=3101276 RepID=UPI003B02777D